jgi:hypothetical protein
VLYYLSDGVYGSFNNIVHILKYVSLLLTHSLTHSHSHTHSLSHSLTHSHTHSLSHSLTHSHTHSLSLILSLGFSLLLRTMIFCVIIDLWSCTSFTYSYWTRLFHYFTEWSWSKSKGENRHSMSTVWTDMRFDRCNLSRHWVARTWSRWLALFHEHGRIYSGFGN